MMAQQSGPHAPPEAPLAPRQTPEPIYKRLTHRQLGIILALSQEGKTQVQIAQTLGCDQRTVGRALQKLGTDTTELAKHEARKSAYSVARRLTRIAVKSSDEDAAIKAGKTLWQAAGVIQSGQQVTVNTAVMIAQPDKPETWGPGPSFIEAKVVSSSAETGDDNA
jgi:DNA-binding CsgD family transcriptional regulator